MDPLSMGMSAVSSVLPLAGKGMDLVGKLVNSATQAAGRAQGKIGGDAHQKNEHQITFNNVNQNSIKVA
ncbi:hypothetical protein ASE80_24360 [Pseudomonas sp. Leaf15]|uniref:hypothetical protein n=1 Tax=unclassified Pseudomonas TaxID=196821 RepID=UPI0007024406|nr:MULTISPECIES: hypothetical protein [unclassified Pseudomonas]KQM53868.1 hypothetical protein ASE80_24360 [Pseudomonas sp. Leaf15]RAG99856.1 hypothetical protein DJ480_26220 [Pseudomonas sp. Leaf98]